ncbi:MULTISPECIES: hypothetical protein [unclassified Butyrivibrio]|uniref:hypothetical protein n=1 Tax=unclassified Butyrivibrio TaxID=2639466 RepID=UPI0003B3806D|nr:MULTISPECIES: hypothetical protein [unclassified Butyrivibrio]
MEDNKRELEKQLILLKKLKKRSDENLKKLKNAPEECIRTSSRGNFHQYYRKDENSGKRIYVNKKKFDEIRPIIQKEYELKVNKVINEQISILEKYIIHSNINAITDIYKETSNAKKAMITPIISTDEDYIKKWLASMPPCQNPYPPKRSFETMNKEISKSKSEKIIADTMFNMKIPYIYEPRLDLDNRITKYPDFVALNIKKRKTIYWEHLGRLGDADYCLDNFNKLMIYEQNGIVLGDNLIITMESNDIDLDIHSVYENINRYLM